MEILGVLIQVVVTTILLSPALWIAGRLLVGKEKAKFTDALWIVFLGSLIGALGGALLDSLTGRLIGLIVMLIVWLALIKHFFDCGWLKAFVIAIVAVILFVVIIVILGIILAVIGIALIGSWF